MIIFVRNRDPPFTPKIIFDLHPSRQIRFRNQNICLFVKFCSFWLSWEIHIANRQQLSTTLIHGHVGSRSLSSWLSWNQRSEWKIKKYVNRVNSDELTWIYIKIFDYGQRLWLRSCVHRIVIHQTWDHPEKWIKILKSSFQIQKLIIEGKWVKVYRKRDRRRGLRFFRSSVKSMSKVGAYNFFLELMNFQTETVRRISFPFGQRPKQTLLTYGQGRRNELFSGEARKISPFIYPRC